VNMHSSNTVISMTIVVDASKNLNIEFADVT